LVIIINLFYQIMKKALLIFVLLFTFSLSANAQAEKKGLPEKKQLSIQEKAKINLTDLTSLVKIEDPSMETALMQLFVSKYKMITSENITEAEKKEVSNLIDAKLRATLNDELIKKLETEGVYKKLIN
jgi:hypothetical protein